MSGRAVAACVAAVMASTGVSAWAQGQRAVGQGPVAAAPTTLRAAAPTDLTGTWVSVVTEDWRWRMMTPPKYDYAAVPLSAAGRTASDRWDPAADEKNGLQCRLYGAASVMRLPGRLQIAWADDNTLRIQTDAGTQTRHLRYGARAPNEERTWQGHTTASWQVAEGVRGGRGGRGGAAQRGGQLKAVTTNMRAGLLRKNGVPYSERAVLTEYFLRLTAPNKDEWLVVTSIVDDPEYLNEPFITSTHFKKEPDNAKFTPTPCAVPR